MFTGIIEASVPVIAVANEGNRVRLVFDLPESMREGVKLGDSIAINGVCLTVARLTGARVEFEAVPETLKLTSLGDLRAGSLANLERAMLAGARFDGHMVQGHVDGTGTVKSIVDGGGEWRVTIAAGREFCNLCVHKGSVCIDGISLTIAELTDETLTVAIIPHSWKVTNLSRRKVGDAVNLEADVLGKHVRKQLLAIFGESLGMGESVGGLTIEKLKRQGYAVD